MDHSRELDRGEQPRESDPHANAREDARTHATTNDPEIVRGRERVHEVSDTQRRTLCDVGRFRTIETGDLKAALYGGRERPMRRDLAWLAAQGLVQRRTVWLGKRRGRLDVVVLARAAKELLERADA